jgi:hypothetical protein
MVGGPMRLQPADSPEDGNCGPWPDSKAEDLTMKRSGVLMGMTVLLLGVGVAQAQTGSDGTYGKEPQFRTAEVSAVVKQLEAWLSAQGVDAATRAAILQRWEGVRDATGVEVTRRLAESFAEADDRARLVWDLCAAPYDGGLLPDLRWLKGDDLPAFMSANLRVYLGRWLCQYRLYDEAVFFLQEVHPSQVVDPASLLFFRSVALHKLSVKKEGLESIALLLDDVADSPQRYVSVAGLMMDDLKALKEDSLNEISRLMDDVERRLSLGRAGKRVRQKEDEIVAKLDKLIEELEQQQQQQQQQQSSSSSGGTTRSTSPAPQSGILGGQGPGNVDRRNLEAGNAWGNLPPKEREEALQQIGKDFPPHYREFIERYFRRMAESPSR